mmetsp:Transcript_22487/g.63414  ORF Transcript_22487/g.63414 Transcript_22487/m.63414 type:complete len:315 (-) Transcript_22487:1625-2569(-)
MACDTLPSASPRTKWHTLNSFVVLRLKAMFTPSTVKSSMRMLPILVGSKSSSARSFACSEGKGFHLTTLGGCLGPNLLITPAHDCVAWTMAFRNSSKSNSPESSTSATSRTRCTSFSVDLQPNLFKQAFISLASMVPEPFVSISLKTSRYFSWRSSSFLRQVLRNQCRNVSMTPCSNLASKDRTKETDCALTKFSCECAARGPGFRIAKSSTSILRHNRRDAPAASAAKSCAEEVGVLLVSENHNSNRMAPMDMFRPGTAKARIQVNSLPRSCGNSSNKRHRGMNEHIIAACVTPPAKRLDKYKKHKKFMPMKK